MNENPSSSPTPPPTDEHAIPAETPLPTEEPSTAPDIASVPPPPAPAAGGTAFGSDMDAKQWAMLLHLSQLAGVLVPGLGLAAPIVIWQIKKSQFPELDPHGKMVTNWIISVLIYCVAASLLSVITCGFGALLFVPIAVVAIVFPILGGLKARDGLLWQYPLTIIFLK
jgi:hypothetical protein